MQNSDLLQIKNAFWIWNISQKLPNHSKILPESKIQLSKSKCNYGVI